MMPGYNWMNSSWATDLLTYAVFHKMGFAGLSLLGALVITGTFYFFSRAAKLNFWEQSLIIPLILAFNKPLFEVSFRGQLLSLLFLSVLFYIIRLFEDGTKKAIFLTVPLFILWSNFHGQYIEGVGLFYMIMGILYLGRLVGAKEKIVRKKIFREAVLTGIFSLAAGLSVIINPFGTGVITEAVRHFGNPLQKYIVEWIPFDKFSILWWNLIFWDLLVLVSILIINMKGKIIEMLHYIVPTVFMLIMSFYVRRYSWSMVLISIPVIRYTVSLIEPKTREISLTLASMIFIFLYGYSLLVQAPEQNIAGMTWARHCSEFVGCSPKSAEFLLKAKLPGKMMTFYNWGGWLIWNYPGIKPSIDGRMHLWKDDLGYSAFADYYPYEQNWRDIDKSTYDIVYMTLRKPVYGRLTELVKMGKWEQVYKDDFAGVFVRVKKS